MPKVKVKRKNISLDMTAMCDMAFLLLTFFILSAKFKPNEPIVVDIPSAYTVSEKVVPDSSIMLISFDKGGKIFFGIDNQLKRRELIEEVSSRLKIDLTEEEKKKFSSIETFGIPMAELKTYLNKSGSALMLNHPGIPADSSGNELKNWIVIAKQVNPNLVIAIKGDRMANFKDVKKVNSTLQDLGLNHVNYITSLEGKPEL